MRINDPVPPCPISAYHRWEHVDWLELEAAPRRRALLVEGCERCGLERHTTVSLDGPNGRRCYDVEYRPKGT